MNIIETEAQRGLGDLPKISQPAGAICFQNVYT